MPLAPSRWPSHHAHFFFQSGSDDLQLRCSRRDACFAVPALCPAPTRAEGSAEDFCHARHRYACAKDFQKQTGCKDATPLRKASPQYPGSRQTHSQTQSGTGNGARCCGSNDSRSSDGGPYTRMGTPAALHQQRRPGITHCRRCSCSHAAATGTTDSGRTSRCGPRNLRPYALHRCC